jgi:hypothetical protein
MQRRSKLALVASTGVVALACWRAASHRPSAEVFASDALAAAGGASERQLALLFRDTVKQNLDLEAPELLDRLGAKGRSDVALGFDPSKVRFYDRVVEQMQLTRQEQKLFQKQGLVGVDIGQRSSMGSAYFTIYTADLPVLITSDSILHAFHRSFDASLKQLEEAVLKPLLDDTLANAQLELAAQATAVSDPELLASMADVDLYLNVARRLSTPDDAIWPKLARAVEVQAILDKVEQGKLETSARIIIKLLKISTLKW